MISGKVSQRFANNLSLDFLLSHSWGLYHDRVKSSLFDCVKASGLNDRKLTCIDLILANLRSSNSEALTLVKKATFHPIVV